MYFAVRVKCDVFPTNAAGASCPCIVSALWLPCPLCGCLVRFVVAATLRLRARVQSLHYIVQTHSPGRVHSRTSSSQGEERLFFGGPAAVAAAAGAPAPAAARIFLETSSAAAAQTSSSPTCAANQR